MTRQLKKEVKCEYCKRKVLKQYQDGEFVVWEWLKPRKAHFIKNSFYAEGYWRHDCDKEGV